MPDLRMPDAVLSIVPFTFARLYGPGTPDACRSRAGQIVARALRLLKERSDFRFLIDGPGMLDGYLAERSGEGERIAEAVATGRLAVGGSWTAVGGWPMVGEELVRNLLFAGLWHRDRGTKGVGLLVERGGLGDQLPQLVAQSGMLARAFVVDDIAGGQLQGIDGQKLSTVPLAGAIDLDGLDGSRPVVGRDTEKALVKGLAVDPKSVLPWGGLLRQPSGEVLEALEEWRDAESVNIRFAGPEALPDLESDRAGEAWRGHEESLYPDAVPAALACAHILLRAERAVALAESATGASGDSDGLTAAWRRLLALRDGTLSGTGDTEKRLRILDDLRDISSLARGIRERAERRISLEVDAGEGPAGTLPIVVFNHTGWLRSDPVDVPVTLYGEGRPDDFERYEQYRIVDADGNPVSVEETGGKQVETAELAVRFLAERVPPFGYRTYYLVPRPHDLEPAMSIQAPGAMAPHFPEPTFALEDVEDSISEPFRGIRVGRTFTANRYQIVLDEVSGRIVVRERKGGLVLVDGLHVAACEVDLRTGLDEAAETGRVFGFALDRADLESSGGVSATLLLKGKVLTSPCELRLTLHADVDRIDVEVKLAWRDPKPARVRVVFPHVLSDPEILHGVPFGAGRLGAEMGERKCAGWVQIRGDSGGLVLASERQSFTFTRDEVRSEILYSTVDPSSYAYNRVWRTYPDEVRCRYTLRYDEGSPEAAAPWRDGEQLAHPLSACVVYDRDSPRRLPDSYSTVALEGEGLVVSALLPGAKPGALILRAYESRGQGSVGRIRLEGRTPGVQACDLNGARAVNVDPDAVSFRPYEIKNLRISPEGDPLASSQ